MTAEYNLIYPSQGTGSNKSDIPLINIHLVGTTFLFYVAVYITSIIGLHYLVRRPWPQLKIASAVENAQPL